MFLRKKLTRAGVVLQTALGAGVQAQQPQPSTQNQTPGNDTRRFGGGEDRRGMRHFGRGPLGALRELNLSDDQKKEVRAIMERNFESTKSSREELRTLGQKRFEGTLTPEEQARAKELHQQMAESMQNAMTELTGILTVGHKARLEELRKDEGRKGGLHGRRFGGPDSNQNNPLKP